ncbi:MAG: hypothetical protein ACR2NP_21745 [Pirellulaceae bacterium]
MNRQRRRHALKTRLALIALGVGLGLSARWIDGWISDGQQPAHFEPMPERLDDRLLESNGTPKSDDEPAPADSVSETVPVANTTD